MNQTIYAYNQIVSNTICAYNLGGSYGVEKENIQ